MCVVLRGDSAMQSVKNDVDMGDMDVSDDPSMVSRLDPDTYIIPSSGL